jgi:heterodisulfide reductase subunit A-like polyferredoxin
MHRLGGLVRGVAVATLGVGVAYSSRHWQTAHAAPMSEDNGVLPLSRLPTRANILSRQKAEEFDVLVIGGGATGLGIALDAQTRGLTTACVERDDFASGTSSRSTKLIHGAFVQRLTAAAIGYCGR